MAATSLDIAIGEDRCARPLAVWDGTAPVPPNFRGPATNSGDDKNPVFVTKARGQRFSGLALAALTLKTGLLF